MDIYDALRLIAARSEIARHEAVKSLRAPKATLQMRYNLVAEAALNDASADWTPNELDALLGLVIWPDDETRSEVLSPIRVTPREKSAIEAAAAEAGQTVSEFIRRRTLG